MDRAEMLATKLSEALARNSDLEREMREINNMAYTILKVMPDEDRNRKAVELILRYSSAK